jgi:hypothetical protein
MTGRSTDAWKMRFLVDSSGGLGIPQAPLSPCLGRFVVSSNYELILVGHNQPRYRKQNGSRGLMNCSCDAQRILDLTNYSNEQQASKGLFEPAERMILTTWRTSSGEGVNAVLLSFTLSVARGTGLNAYGRHHARVLVTEDVAVKDEIANVRPAEVEAEPNRGVRMVRVLVPERNLDRILDR